MSDEFSRIARLRERFASSNAATLVGIGDDAAVLRASSSNTVVTVDAAVEGTHFRRSFAPWDVLARRAMVAAASDLAAMGARPRAAVVAMTLPPDIDDAAFDALMEGSAQCADEIGAPIVGGNLSAGRDVTITTTWIGETNDKGLLRSGANVGDVLCVTGPLGGSALGLAALLRETPIDASHEAFVTAWRRPVARTAEGLQLRSLATACIDISDGTLQDLGHLCESSGVSAELDLSRIPLRSQHAQVAAALGVDPWVAALSGGEDYELLFTIPAHASVPSFATPIGTIRAGRGVRLLGAPESLSLSASGYGHFRT